MALQRIILWWCNDTVRHGWRAEVFERCAERERWVHVRDGVSGLPHNIGEFGPSEGESLLALLREEFPHAEVILDL
jgi:hypothetical protein